MQWIEIINLRTIEHGLENLVRDFIRPITENAEYEGLIRTTIYYHAALETDLSIHLCWKTNPSDRYKTSLGLRLVDTLKNFGLTYHSAWVASDTNHPNNPFGR